MSDLIIHYTFAKSHPPVAVGRNVKVDAIAIGVASAQGNLIATSSQYIVVEATAECWVAVGTNPTAVPVTSDESPFVSGGSWHFQEGQVRDFWIEKGDKVAVIQA